MFFPNRESEITRPLSETSDIYRDHIKPKDTVVVVGPSTSIYNDTSAFLVSTILAGQGSFYVVDPQVSGDRMDWGSVSRRAGGYVTGAGGIDRHLEELRVLKKIGMRMTTPKWLGKKSSAQRMDLADSSCDVVADHNTALFIAGLRGDNEEERWQRTIKVFREYARVLKTGGSLLFQTNHQYDFVDSTSNLKMLLQRVGITAVKQVVDDIIRIPVPLEICRKITSQDKSLPKVKSNLYLYKYLKSIISQQGPNYFFLFDKPHRFSDDAIQYWCPDFYIGRRT